MPGKGPFYIAAVRNPIWLDGGHVGDEGMVEWRGKLAGPFPTFERAEAALAECDCPEGETKGVWAEGSNQFLTEEML